MMIWLMVMQYRRHVKFWQNRPEFKRLGVYADLLSDELLRALKRCEIEGVTVLMGANDEH